MNRHHKTQWIEALLRWVLAVVFLYAAIDKILYPAAFAKIIYGYELFPAVTINLIAIIIPFLELIASLALISGIYPESAAMMLNIMLTGFITAISINLIRGHEFDCGCFTVIHSSYATGTRQLLIRDIFLLIIGVFIMVYNRPRRFCLKPVRDPEPNR